ncbi:MAG: ABC transporter substrate-binding protein [Comamonas sp.]
MKTGIGFIAAAVLTVAAGMAQADQLADIQKKGQLIVGVLGTDEPNSFIDPKTRELVGYDVELGKAVAQKIGVKPVFKQLTVAARIPELQQGHVDVLAASLTHTKEREAQLDFSITTFVTGQTVLVKKSSGINDVPDLAGKRVVTVKGGTQEPNTKKAVPTATVITFDTAPQAFLALQQGKGAAFVNDDKSVVRALVQLGEQGKDYKILPSNLSIEPLALGIKKGETALKQAVDSALRDLEASGKAEALYEQWYGQQSPLKMPKRNFKFDSDKVSE